MGELLITVIVPFYNSATTLDRCLSSLVPLVQEGGSVILVDDGSTDCSRKVADLWAERYGWTIISQKNQGLGAARQVGLEQAQSRYVCFVDSDDFINPSTWSIASEIADLNEADIVRCRLQLVWDLKEIGSSVETTEGGRDWWFAKPQSLPVGMPGVTTGLYRLETLRRFHVAFPHVRTAEDLAFVYLSARASSTVIQLERVGYYYVQGGSFQLSKARNALPEVIRALETCLPEVSAPISWRLAYWRMYWRAVAGIARRSAMPSASAAVFGLLPDLVRKGDQVAMILGLAIEVAVNLRYVPRYLWLAKSRDAAWVRRSHFR